MHFAHGKRRQKMKSEKTARSRIISLLLTLSLLLSLNVSASPASALDIPTGVENRETDSVYVGGMPLGIKLYTGGLLVVGLSPVKCADGDVSPAEDAGIKIGDVITELNGESISSASEFAAVLESSVGDVSVKYTRDGKESTATLTPAASEKDGRLKSGMWLRDSTAGIGTVTFIMPETREFAALGHGVGEPESGKLISMKRGVAAEARICGIQKGAVGTPGELRGYFTGRDIGTICKNTSHGVFGTFDCEIKNELCPNVTKLGTRDELKLGEAVIFCTLDGDEISSHKIKITRLNGDGPNFEIEVCDDELLSLTGGIVQGMSGSPILQDGRLVGAVTHVLINNPRRGYGIYIEDMIHAAG